MQPEQQAKDGGSGRQVLHWIVVGLACGVVANVVAVSMVAYTDSQPILQELLAATKTFATLVYYGSIPLGTWAEVTVLAPVPTMPGFLFAFFSEWKLTKKYPKIQRVQLCEEDCKLLRRALGTVK